MGAVVNHLGFLIGFGKHDGHEFVAQGWRSECGGGLQTSTTKADGGGQKITVRFTCESIGVNKITLHDLNAYGAQNHFGVDDISLKKFSALSSPVVQPSSNNSNAQFTQAMAAFTGASTAVVTGLQLNTSLRLTTPICWLQWRNRERPPTLSCSVCSSRWVLLCSAALGQAGHAKSNSTSFAEPETCASAKAS